MTMDNKQTEKKVATKKVVKSTKPKSHKVDGLTGLTFAGVSIVDGSVTLTNDQYLYAVSVGWCK